MAAGNRAAAGRKISMQRKRVGLLINQVVSDYIAELLHGALRAAEDSQSDIYIFSNALMVNDREDESEAYAIRYNRNVVYSYSTRMGLDAVVIAYDGIKQCNKPGDFERLLGEIEQKPCIILETKLPGFRCLRTDQGETIRGMMEHLILHHGYTRIGCIRGPVGSPDADLRFQIYKGMMEKYGLPCGEDYVETGTFMPDSGELVRNLVRRHPDLQAVFCSNDFVAISACDVLRKMGYEPGVDIAVTGVDNIEKSMRVSHPITTVETGIYSLGYEGVHEAIRLLEGLPQQTFYIPSRLVIRQSCGCRPGMSDFDEAIRRLFPMTEASLPKIARAICDFSHKRAPSEKTETPIFEDVEAILFAEWRLAEGEDLDEEVFGHIENISRKLNRLHMSANLFLSVYGCAAEILGESIGNVERKLAYQQGRYRAVTYFMRFNERNSREEVVNVGKSALEAPALTDVIVYNTDFNKGMLGQIAQTLVRMNLSNAVILLFPEPVPVYREDGVFQTGKKAAIVLKLVGGKYEYPADPQHLQYRELDSLLGEIYPEDAPAAARMLFVLQSEGEQFGLLLCDVGSSNFVEAYLASHQIGSALKVVQLQRQHYELERQLQSAINTISEKNRILERITNYDSLTMVYNRRGMLESMKKAMSHNQGCEGILLFMDINNLKQINDRYGHNAGDYAISSFARILRSVLRGEDIIGRYGGDEFMALLINDRAISESSEKEAEQSIRHRIRKAFDAFNDVSEKPYYVEASIGIYFFRITEQVDFDHMFNMADRLLYLDKQYKRTDVAKEPYADV